MLNAWHEDPAKQEIINILDLTSFLLTPTYSLHKFIKIGGCLEPVFMKKAPPLLKAHPKGPGHTDSITPKFFHLLLEIAIYQIQTNNYISLFFAKMFSNLVYNLFQLFPPSSFE